MATDVYISNLNFFFFLENCWKNQRNDRKVNEKIERSMKRSKGQKKDRKVKEVIERSKQKKKKDKQQPRVGLFKKNASIWPEGGETCFPQKVYRKGFVI